MPEIVYNEYAPIEKKSSWSSQVSMLYCLDIKLKKAPLAGGYLDN